MNLNEWLSTQPADEQRGFLDLPTCLAKSNGITELYDLLTDFEFIEVKIKAKKPQPLLVDYTLALNSNLAFSQEQSTTLRLIQEALQLSAHILSQNVAHLPSQLYGRLMSQESLAIQKFLQQINDHATNWLRPLLPTLTPVNYSLLHTISAFVTDIALTSDNQYLIVALADMGIFEVYYMETGYHQATVYAHDAPLTQLLTTTHYLITIAKDNLVKIWQQNNRGEWQKIQTFSECTTEIKQMKVTPNEHYLLTASYKETKIWDLVKGELRHSFGGGYIGAVSADNLHAIITTRDDTIILNLETGQIEQTLAQYIHQDRPAQFFPGSQHFAFIGSGSMVEIWDMATGEELFALPDQARQFVISSNGQTMITLAHLQEHLILNFWQVGNQVARLKQAQRYLPQKQFEQSLAVTTLEGHEAEIEDLALFMEGQMLGSISTDGQINIWSLHTHKIVQTLTCEHGRMHVLAATSDGHYLMAGSNDYYLTIWERKNGRFVASHTLRTKDKIGPIALHPDGRHILFAGYGPSSHYDLTVCDIIEGQELGTFAPHEYLRANHVAISPDGQYALVTRYYGQVEIWDLNNFNLVSLKPYSYEKMDVYFLGIEGQYWITGDKNQEIIFDVAKQKPILVHITHDAIRATQLETDSYDNIDELVGLIHLVPEKNIGILRSNWPITSMKITPNLSYVIATSKNSIQLWDLARWLLTPDQPKRIIATLGTVFREKFINKTSSATLKPFRTIDLKLELQPMMSTDLFLTPDGQKIIVNFNNVMSIYNVALGQCEQILAGGYTHPIQKMLATTNGQHLISLGKDKIAKIWDISGLRSRFPTQTVRPHQGNITQVGVTSQGQYGLSLAADNCLIIWNLSNCEQLFTLRDISHEHGFIITFDDSKLIALTTSFKVKMWNIITGQEIMTIPVNNLKTMKVTPDGQHLIILTEKLIQIWDLTTGQLFWSLASNNSGASGWGGYQPNDYNSFKDVAITPDKKYLIICCTQFEPMVWHVPSSRALHPLNPRASLSTESYGPLQITPDGRHVILRTVGGVWEKYHIAMGVYNYRLANISGHDNVITPNGEWLIAGSMDGTIQVYDLKNGSMLFSLPTSNNNELISIQLVTTPRSQQLVSFIKHTSALTIWNLMTQTMITAYDADSKITSCAVTSNGQTMMVGCHGGQIHFLTR